MDSQEDATPLKRELYVRVNCTSDLHNANFLWSERCRRERESYVALPFYSVRKRRMEMLRRLPGYQVMMKDCFFGGRYPVAALVIIELLRTEASGMKRIYLIPSPMAWVLFPASCCPRSQPGNSHR